MNNQYSASNVDIVKNLLAIRSFINRRKVNLSVFVLGDEPFSEDELFSLCSMFNISAITLSEFETVSEALDYLPQIKFVILGRTDWNNTFLINARRFNQHFEFITQEDFANLILDGDFEPYFHGDSRTSLHPALTYLESIHFPWPSTVAYPNPNQVINPESDWDSESDFKKVTGYSVKKGISVHERKDALNKGVDVFGLQYTAKHIAWLVRTAKRRNDDLMVDANNNREDDLRWLKKQYYDNTEYSFRWPET